MPFLTPANIPTLRVCRTIRVPDSPEWLSIYNGVISELLGAFEWEQDDPTHITPLQARDAAQAIFFEYMDSHCMIGAIVPSIVLLPSPYFLPMDGASHPASDFPELFAMLPGNFILGESQFFLPNLSRMVLAQYDPGYTPIGGDLHNWSAIYSAIGESDHKLVLNELAVHSHGTSHTHSQPSHVHTTDPHSHGYIPAVPNATTIGPGAPQPTAIPGAAATAIGGGGSTSASGADTTSSQSKTVTTNTGADAVHNTVQQTYLLRYFMVSK